GQHRDQVARTCDHRAGARMHEQGCTRSHDPTRGRAGDARRKRALDHAGRHRTALPGKVGMNDYINAAFESMAGVFVFLSAWRVYKDREVRGVSAWMVVFMLTWGLWNLYYYPSLGQWGSFYGGLS